MTLPEPLTPPECDLRGLRWLPLDVIALEDSDLMAISSGAEFKAAVRIWGRAWRQTPAASIPNDARVLASWAGVSVEEWERLAPVALRGFEECADGRLYHRVLAAKALEAFGFRKKQQEKAAKRWGKNAGDMPRHNHGKAPAQAGHMPIDRTGQDKTLPSNSSNSQESSASRTTQPKKSVPFSARVAAETPAPSKPKSKRASGCEAFDAAWGEWTQKGRSSKAKALREWTASDAAPGVKLAAVRRYLASKDAKKDAGAYVPAFERWLRDRLESWIEAAPSAASVRTPSELPSSPPSWAAVAAIIAAEEPAAWRSYGAQCSAVEIDGELHLTAKGGTAAEKLSRIIEAMEARLPVPVFVHEPKKGPAR